MAQLEVAAPVLPHVSARAADRRPRNWCASLDLLLIVPSANLCRTCARF